MKEPPEPSHEKETSDTMFDGSDVLPSGGLRYSIQDTVELERFLLDFNFHFLPVIGAVLLFVFFIVQVF